MKSDNTLMPFGKHAGKPVREIPLAYVAWLATNWGIRRTRPDISRVCLALLVERCLTDYDAVLEELDIHELV